jgi:hypothetical protein
MNVNMNSGIDMERVLRLIKGLRSPGTVVVQARVDVKYLAILASWGVKNGFEARSIAELIKAWIGEVGEEIKQSHPDLWTDSTVDAERVVSSCIGPLKRSGRKFLENARSEQHNDYFGAMIKDQTVADVVRRTYNKIVEQGLLPSSTPKEHTHITQELIDETRAALIESGTLIPNIRPDRKDLQITQAHREEEEIRNLRKGFQEMLPKQDKEEQS